MTTTTTRRFVSANGINAAAGSTVIRPSSTDVALIQPGQQWIEKDNRQRESRITTRVPGIVLRTDESYVYLSQPTRQTRVRLDRFLKRYVQVIGNSNGSH